MDVLADDGSEILFDLIRDHLRTRDERVLQRRGAFCCAVAAFFASVDITISTVTES